MGNAWASTANYPGSPPPTWAGLPTKIMPAYTYFTPDQPPAAQELNWLFNRQDSQIGSIAVAAWMEAVANWNPLCGNPAAPGAGGTFFVPGAACYDAFNQRWLVGCTNVTGVGAGISATIQATDDGGKTWFGYQPGMGHPTYTPIAMAVNPTNGTLCLVRSQNGGTGVVTTRFASGSAVDTTQGFMSPGGGPVDQGVLAYFSGEFVFVGGTGFASPSFTGVFGLSTSDGVGSWTDVSGTLPIGWQTGTNHILQYIAGQSATDLVVAMCGVTPVNDASRLLRIGVAISDITPAFLGGASKQIRGVAYSTNDNLWGLLTWDGAASYLHTSPDLSTWTLIHTWTGYVAGGLATIGSVWAALLYSPTLDEGGNRIFYSGDVAIDGASAVFNAADYSDPHTLTSLTLPITQMQSSGVQLMTATIQGAGATIPIVSVGFSLKTGFLGLTPTGSGIGGGGITGAGVNVEINGVPIPNNPHVTINFTGASSGSDAGGGVANVNPGTTGGGFTLVTVNGPTTATLAAFQRARVSVTSGPATINAPPTPNDGDEISVKNSAGDCSAAGHNITVSGNGHNIEDPNSLGSFVASVVLNVRGADVDWQYDVTNTRWMVV